MNIVLHLKEEMRLESKPTADDPLRLLKQHNMSDRPFFQAQQKVTPV